MEHKYVDNTAASNMNVPKTGENLPSISSEIHTQDSIEFRSKQKQPPVKRVFGFCFEFSCGDGSGDGCCCCA